MLKLNTVFCTFLFTTVFSATVFGTNITASMRIESHDKTLWTGNIDSEISIQDALTLVSENNNIEVQYKKYKGATVINSINGIENNLFGENDGWYTYITKNDEIIYWDNPLNTIIGKGETLVVCYVDIENTKVIDLPTLAIDDRNLTFKINSDFSPEGIKVHVETPKDTQRILISNSTGTLTSKVNDLGYYQYYGEYYNYNNYPKVVKTEEKTFFVGPKDNNKVTRGEAIDYIVNHLNLTSNNTTNPFADVSFNDFYYSEALIAYDNNIISGYKDSTFQGNKYITLSELSVMLTKAQKSTDTPSTTYTTNAPQWAKASVNYCIDKEMFARNDDFTRFVTLDDLYKISY